MTYRELALLATKAADNAEYNEIYEALAKLTYKNQRAYAMKERVAKRCEATVLDVKEREVIDFAIDSLNDN